jgi:hypothetical protein
MTPKHKMNSSFCALARPPVSGVIGRRALWRVSLRGA